MTLSAPKFTALQYLRQISHKFTIYTNFHTNYLFRSNFTVHFIHSKRANFSPAQRCKQPNNQPNNYAIIVPLKIFVRLFVKSGDWQFGSSAVHGRKFSPENGEYQFFPPSIFSKIWWKSVDFGGFWAKNLTSLRDAALRRGRSPRMQLAHSPLLRPQAARGDNVGPRG